MPSELEKTLAQDWVVELLAKPVLARLGTANAINGQPHVTPVWFQWDGECLYISVFVVTRKGREVTNNPKISVLIDTDEPTQAVLFEGTADVLAGTDEVRARSEAIYARYVGEDEVKKDPYAGWAKDPENRLIRLRPEKVYSWSW